MIISRQLKPEDYTKPGQYYYASARIRTRFHNPSLTIPRSLDDAIAITEQEAWVRRNGMEYEGALHFTCQRKHSSTCVARRAAK